MSLKSIIKKKYYLRKYQLEKKVLFKDNMVEMKYVNKLPINALSCIIPSTSLIKLNPKIKIKDKIVKFNCIEKIIDRKLNIKSKIYKTDSI